MSRSSHSDSLHTIWGTDCTSVSVRMQLTSSLMYPQGIANDTSGCNRPAETEVRDEAFVDRKKV
jgi:hypothetical protein